MSRMPQHDSGAPHVEQPQHIDASPRPLLPQPRPVPERRIRFRDIKPYEAPESLDELRGPATGVVRLPISIRWVPGQRAYDVRDDAAARVIYQAVLAEGTVVDQRRFLNAQRLVELWPTLNLDQRVVRLWEGRFHELRGLLWATVS